ncbi:DUF2871 domain-containing protein [uncultured Tyzzerella sp.]|uniref:DUF2871 domain-containing protein n=1 Tax=uncultured Tyzzerella sp. TaxID=2321398 RepID=UPI0029438474|nr:DUF2871 domain-containing protein [uncultured Tyzzerella sp.]
MKKLINISFIYFILAMISGVFYREFTKFFNFTDKTTLSFTHSHLLTLGTVLFLILSLFSINTDLLSHKKFKTFLRFYNISLPFMIIMMIIRGVIQVLNVNISSGANAAISGMAGIAHMLMLVSFIILFVILKNTNVDRNNKQ